MRISSRFAAATAQIENLRRGALRQYTPMDTVRYELKTLNRQFNLYSKAKTSLSNNLIALLDQSFPEG